ncbi:hypothetical protein ABZ345_43770 [Lentzea sp. NPDC005914]|uniref:hypothetical protein n=1 Tax=Lentzea sp. NPDC005914 TaxID=3154572 RepID=UPI00340ED33F
MPNFLQLHSHFVQRHPGGIGVNTLRSTLALGDGTTVSWELPSLPIDSGLVLVPAVYTEGDTSLRVDFSRWTPGFCGNGFGALLPFTTTDQAQAVRLARAFHAAPDTSWRDSAEKVAAWVRSWREADEAFRADS